MCHVKKREKSLVESARAWVDLCVITHGGTSVPTSKTYLPLLLLPGGVQQQVPVPVVLLDHIRLFMADRVGVAVCHLGFDSCHRAASFRTSQAPLSL